MLGGRGEDEDEMMEEEDRKGRGNAGDHLFKPRTQHPTPDTTGWLEQMQFWSLSYSCLFLDWSLVTSLRLRCHSIIRNRLGSGAVIELFCIGSGRALTPDNQPWLNHKPQEQHGLTMLHSLTVSSCLLPPHLNYKQSVISLGP